MSLHFPGPREALSGRWEALSAALRDTAGSHVVTSLLGLVVLLEAVALGQVPASPCRWRWPAMRHASAARTR